MWCFISHPINFYFIVNTFIVYEITHERTNAPLSWYTIPLTKNLSAINYVYFLEREFSFPVDNVYFFYTNMLKTCTTFIDIKFHSIFFWISKLKIRIIMNKTFKKYNQEMFSKLKFAVCLRRLSYASSLAFIFKLTL